MRLVVVGVFACKALYALGQDPWLGNAYEWDLSVLQSYSRYRWIDQAKVQPIEASNSYITDVNLGVTLQDFAIDMEWEMARTPRQTYGFRSGALGGRYRILDDVAGDCVSVATGFSVRGVTARAVKDVSSPYSSYFNTEMFFSVGKEFSKEVDWTTRGHITGFVGLANHGSCWNRYFAALETKFFQNHKAEFFSWGYFGYGPNQEVDLSHFQGWGKVRHGSVDIGGSYRYQIGIWGELGFSYGYRVFAYSYPQNTQTATLFYFLPFSFF